MHIKCEYKDNNKVHISNNLHTPTHTHTHMPTHIHPTVMNVDLVHSPV